MNVVDCRALSRHCRGQIKQCVEELGFQPGLAVILVGNDPASMTYVRNKKKACDEVGFHSEILYMPEASATEEVLAAVEQLAKRDDIHGVMVQLPMPDHIDTDRVISAIPLEKDVDALTAASMGKLVLGNAVYEPCTPGGIMRILQYLGVSLSGKHCVIIGRSNIVGKPLAAMMTQENATVTLCHSQTKNLASITKQADILISAVGKPNFVTADMVSDGAIVIDVGINRTEKGKLVGDVCFDEVKNIAGAITPVPGGVGVMTVTSLLMNTYHAAVIDTVRKRKTGGEIDD